MELQINGNNIVLKELEEIENADLVYFNNKFLEEIELNISELTDTPFQRLIRVSLDNDFKQVNHLNLLSVNIKITLRRVKHLIKHKLIVNLHKEKILNILDFKADLEIRKLDLRKRLTKSGYLKLDFLLECKNEIKAIRELR